MEMHTAAEVFSASKSSEYTKVRRQSSNTSRMADSTLPFLMHLRDMDFPHSNWELRFVTEQSLTRKILPVQAFHMCGFVGKWAQESGEGMNTENTGYCQTLT